MKAGCAHNQRGMLMIEVLVTIAIVILGLAALMQLQAALQKSEIESYQRSQALMLLDDMSSRLLSNRPNAEDYLTTSRSPAYLGGDPSTLDCSTIGSTTLQERDSQEWCEALQGAGESLAGGNVGAMIGGRGCVELLNATNGIYMLTVVWQGLTPVSAPPASIGCGLASPNPYDGDVSTGSKCVNDLCRRYVTTTVRVKELPVL